MKKLLKILAAIIIAFLLLLGVLFLSLHIEKPYENDSAALKISIFILLFAFILFLYIFIKPWRFFKNRKTVKESFDEIRIQSGELKKAFNEFKEEVKSFNKTTQKDVQSDDDFLDEYLSYTTKSDLYGDSKIEDYEHELIDGLYFVWRGESKYIEFSYYDDSEKKHRFRGNLIGFALNEIGKKILQVKLLNSEETMLIDEYRIDTKILVGSTRKHIDNFFYENLNLLRSHYNGLQYVLSSLHYELKPYLEISPTNIEFSFVIEKNMKKETHRQKLIVDGILRNNANEIALTGLCEETNKRINYKPVKIKSMIVMNDNKYKVKDWLIDFAKVDPELVG